VSIRSAAPLMSNSAPWATTAGNKFREVARTTDNPTTKLLAEGLTALTEALRELDAKLEKVDQQVRSSPVGDTALSAPSRRCRS
jgi:hypothetical protein